MDSRTRFINIARGLPIDRKPYFNLWGPWGETLARWSDEGAPENWTAGFGFDPGFAHVPVNLGYLPAFEYEILKDEGRTVIARDYSGATARMMKGASTIPEYLEFALKDRPSWETLKLRLDPHDKTRFGDNFKREAERLNAGDAVNQIGTYPWGMFGTPRDMFGLENLMFAFYDDPELVREVMDYLTDFWIAIWEEAAKLVRIDAVHIWEDMSGKQGPLISPAMVRGYMGPCYKKVSAFCARHDISIFSVDTDGDVAQLVEPFMESGVTMLFPFEVQAGCDVNEYLKKYPDLTCMGGVNKRALEGSFRDIDEELERLAPAMASRRYLPQLDHLPHPQIPWKNMCYYFERIKELCYGWRE